MSHSDPYAPPSSSLGGPTPAEQHDRDSGVLRYAGAWQRIAAQLLDLLVFMPIIALDVVFGARSHTAVLFTFVLSHFAIIYLYIYMVARYGGSPGKLLLGLRIVMLDGSAATARAALLRYSVLGLLSFAAAIVTLIATMKMPEQAFQALSYLERGSVVDELMPGGEFLVYLMFGWIFGCFVMLLAHAQRRTLHDLMAGTAVVQK
jgi:uncharacterized RDD family membrane protein YckC